MEKRKGAENKREGERRGERGETGVEEEGGKTDRKRSGILARTHTRTSTHTRCGRARAETCNWG